ncbi:hypothetical protein [Maribacter cobaltidurans]|uniref:Uncharacterized protein n=1 Tax=Maribacter cobaltidurans TaxID=1178778 RepID=A0A223V5X7_9FLAO|nr:hypothetical protein [Maribacter cobaltidurans]ASV30716.1 hypothetical protein CJ263_11090 [Maribacter cobaltidurans]GGD81182.1 hypothetical protein GCM10011412_18640 [Maribacter cobaltidurans]
MTKKKTKQITKFFQKNIAGKKVLSLFIITNVVYVFMLTVTIPKTMEFSNGMKLLDMLPMGYDFNYVDQLVNTLGEIGRETYLSNQIPVDMIYPLLFGISYCLVLAYFLNKLDKLKTPLAYLCLLPLLAGAMDYAENLGIIAILNSYPEIDHSTVAITSSFSLLKSTLTTLYFVILIISLGALGIRTLRTGKSTRSH